jgi:6-pyruvoyl-tetrahydropterin synthase
MVVDFKKMKKIIHEYFDQFDHSLILTPENPLTKAYLQNFKENGIDTSRSRLFVWDENPTAEYMSKHWYDIMKAKFEEAGLVIDKLSVSVEETLHNKVVYTED